MARTLILPDRMAPSNLHLRPTVKTRFIEGDLYDICRRLKELDPNLYVLQLEEGDKAAFAIMERCSDGVERLVKKVPELDARVLEDLRYMMAVPLEQRLAMAEADIAAHEARQKEDELEDLYERFGGEMRHLLHKTGFVNAPAPVSLYVPGRA